MRRSVLVGFLSAAVGFSGSVLADQAGSTAAKKPPAQASSKSPSKTVLPAAVEASFKKAYPNATIKHISSEKENGVVLYEIESVDGTQPRDLVYKADGTLVEYEEAIAASAVPEPVMAALNSRYPKATVTKAEKFFKDGSMTYELALKGAKISEVTLTPEGKWISPK